jgi:hypothetical protein
VGGDNRIPKARRHLAEAARETVRICQYETNQQSSRLRVPKALVDVRCRVITNQFGYNVQSIINGA